MVCKFLFVGGAGLTLTAIYSVGIFLILQSGTSPDNQP